MCFHQTWSEMKKYELSSFQLVFEMIKLWSQIYVHISTARGDRTQNKNTKTARSWKLGFCDNVNCSFTTPIVSKTELGVRKFSR